MSDDDIAQLKRMRDRGEITNAQYETLRRHVLWGTPLPEAVESLNAPDEDEEPPATWQPYVPDTRRPDPRPPWQGLDDEPTQVTPQPGRHRPPGDPPTPPPDPYRPATRPAAPWGTGVTPGAVPPAGRGGPPAGPPAGPGSAAGGRAAAQPGGTQGWPPAGGATPTGTQQPGWPDGTASSPGAGNAGGTPYPGRSGTGNAGGAAFTGPPSGAFPPAGPGRPGGPGGPGGPGSTAYTGPPSDAFPPAGSGGTAYTGPPSGAFPPVGAGGTAYTGHPSGTVPAVGPGGTAYTGPPSGAFPPIGAGGTAYTGPPSGAVPAVGAGARRAVPELPGKAVPRKKRKRGRGPIAFVLSLLLAVAIAGAGVWWFVLRQTGVAPADYARGVCGKVQGWHDDVTAKSGALQQALNSNADPEATRGALATFFDQVADRTHQLRSDVDAVGVPAIPTGQSYVDGLDRKLDDTASAFSTSAGKARALDINSPATFEINVQVLQSQVDQQISGVSDALAGTNTPGELRTAYNNDSACAPFTG